MHLDWAAIAILFAIPFDALDGRIARMTNTASDFGNELDSLADVITFGMAPSLLAFVWGFHFLPDSMNPQLQHASHAGWAHSSASCFFSAEPRAWRASTSVTTHSRATPAGQGANTLSACPFLRRPGLLAASVHSLLRHIPMPVLVDRHSLAHPGRPSPDF